MPLPTEPMPADVLAALHHGKTVEAIKLLRQSTGLGLEEAKALVDGHLAGLAQRRGAAPAGGLSPGEMPRSGSGLLWLTVVAVVAALIGYWFLRTP